MERIERSQPSNLEASWSLRLTGNAINAAAAGNALKQSKKVAATTQTVSWEMGSCFNCSLDRATQAS